MVWRAKLRLLAGAALLVLLLPGLSACAGSDRKSNLPPSTSSTGTQRAVSDESGPAAVSATAAPSPPGGYVRASAEGPAQNVPLPIMPEEAKEFSKEGLEAFARHWYALANYGYETGDTAPLRAVSGPACVACNSYYPAVQTGYAGNDWMAGARINIQSVASNFVETPEGRFQVLVQYMQDDLEYHSPEGHLSTYPGDDRPAVQMIEGRHTNGNWTAEDVVTVSR